MLNFDEFHSLLAKQAALFSELEQISSKIRKECIKRWTMFCFFAMPPWLLSLAGLIYAIDCNNGLFSCFLPFLLSSLWVVCTYTSLDPDRPGISFAMDYKRRVILSLIGLVYDYPEYHPAQFISKESLNFYRIFNEEVSLVIGDDLVLCKQNNVKLYFCEINAWSRDNHLFKGLICVIDFHKTFKGQTVVCAKERNYNKCYNNSEKVYLEDPRFTAVFDTYSTNQVTARYILPPNMMENILELKKRWSLNDFSLNFVDGILFFTIEVSKDLFEPSLGKRQCDFKDIFFYYNILEFTKSIIDILNQERRIWSKRDADTDFTKITLDFMLNLYKLPVCVVCKNMSKDDRKNILYSKEHLGYICAECYLKKKFGEYTEVTSFKDVHREWYILTLERIQTYGYQYRDKSLKESEKYLREGLMLGLKPLYDTNGLVSGWSVR